MVLRRDDWLDLARKVDWTPRYVDERELFPEEISGRPWLTQDAPALDHRRIVDGIGPGPAQLAHKADQVKQLWCALAEETVTGLPAQTVAELPGVLKTLTGNVDTRRPRHPHGRRDGG